MAIEPQCKQHSIVECGLSSEQIDLRTITGSFLIGADSMTSELSAIMDLSELFSSIDSLSKSICFCSVLSLSIPLIKSEYEVVSAKNLSRISVSFPTTIQYHQAIL